MIIYVTAFLDIGRGEWKNFNRTTEQYFSYFYKLIDIFDKNPDPGHQLIVYLDKKHADKIQDPINSNILYILIDEDFLSSHIPMWKKLEKETEIMNSEEYKNNFFSRLHFPENSNPKYTLINHAKIDFVCHSMILAEKMGLLNNEEKDYYCWVDFGYCQKDENIPNKLLSLEKFNLDKINYTLINPLNEDDRDISYTMYNAPEKIGGFFFFGEKQKLIEYQNLYHIVHDWFQENNLADDDQHIALRCYFERPEMFELHLLGWHRALTYFQKLD